MIKIYVVVHSLATGKTFSRGWMDYVVVVVTGEKEIPREGEGG